MAMNLSQRHKQRILTTIVTISTFLVGLLLFLALSASMSLEVTLIITFLVCIALLTGYQVHHYQYCHEHATLVNTLTQIYAGSILIAGILIMLLLKLILAIEFTTSYIILSLIIIVLVFLTLGKYDEFLEEHVPKRLAALQPKKKR
jgi:hypothetical protein